MVVKLVEQLGRAEFADRDAAAKQRHELGRKTEPALPAGLRSDDPEVLARCAILPVITRGGVFELLPVSF